MAVPIENSRRWPNRGHEAKRRHFSSDAIPSPNDSLVMLLSATLISLPQGQADE